MVNPISIELVAHTNEDPIALASHAAKTCYNSETPRMGDLLKNPRKQLWDSSHHTTWQHHQDTFAISGIDVSNMKFGLHLSNRFYNSDEMSGRYCSKMFTNPDFGRILNYIEYFWPGLNQKQLDSVMDFIRKSTAVFHENIELATEVAAKMLVEERPHISKKNLEACAPKVAQEQLRMFISMIYPTGLDHSLNITAIAAMYQAAWTPVLKSVTEQIVQLLLGKYKDLEPYFDLPRHEGEWTPGIPEDISGYIMTSPKLEVLDYDIDWSSIKLPDKAEMYPVDQLLFLPEMMNNSVASIRMGIEISAATMGQDQRHRTIDRSIPELTGGFYVPAILRGCGLEGTALDTVRSWMSLAGHIPNSLLVAIAPYGAMVRYQKRGNLNAIAHEQGKRLCFCAQEEIYNLGRLLRVASLQATSLGHLAEFLQPPCYEDGKCAEGDRYCGRDLKASKPLYYFPERGV